MAGSVSKVSICNLALARLGVSRITALTDETVAARLCNELFDPSHRWLLREHQWTFAQKYATLAQLASTDAVDYSYAYTLPTDCLYVLSTDNETDNKRSPYVWEIRGRTLVTELESVAVRYVHLVADFSLISPEYEDLLGWYLAEQMAMPLTKSLKLTDRCERKFAQQFLAAVGADSAHGTGNSEDTGSNELITVRQADAAF